MGRIMIERSSGMVAAFFGAMVYISNAWINDTQNDVLKACVEISRLFLFLLIELQQQFFDVGGDGKDWVELNQTEEPTEALGFTFWKTCGGG
jgi:hypothetical protein